MRSWSCLCPGFPRSCPCRPNRDSVSSPRHLERSRRISRTTLPCPLRAKSYGTHHAGGAFIAGCLWTRTSLKSPGSSCNLHLLHLFQPKTGRGRAFTQQRPDCSAFTLAYILRLRSCRPTDAIIKSPLPPITDEEVMNSRVPSLHGRYPASSLLRTRPPPSRLRSISRWMPVIRPTLLRRFLGGTRTASPVAQRILVTVLPLPPRRSESTRRSGFVDPCCLRPNREGSATGVFKVSRPPVGSLTLRPGDSLTIPWTALSVGFRSFGFPPACDSSYRAPDSCPGGTGSRWMRQPSLDALGSQYRSAAKSLDFSASSLIDQRPMAVGIRAKNQSRIEQ